MTKYSDPKICKNCPINSQLCVWEGEGSFCIFLDHYTLSSTFLKKRTLYVLLFILMLWIFSNKWPKCMRFTNFFPAVKYFLDPPRFQIGPSSSCLKPKHLPLKVETLCYLNNGASINHVNCWRGGGGGLPNDHFAT